MSEKEKSAGQLLKEKLFIKSQHTSAVIGAQGNADADSFADGYMNYLDASKTERESIDTALSMAIAGGFTEFDKTVIGRLFIRSVPNLYSIS